MAYHAPVSDDELRQDVQAYLDSGGNKSEAARRRGLHRKTYLDRLASAQKRLKVKLGKVVDGKVDYARAEKRALPVKGGVARYILSSCQNNTHPHNDGLRNILAYGAWLGALPKSSFEFILGSFSYAVDAYGAKSVKRGTFDEGKAGEELWYDPALVPYIKDHAIALAPGLIWCGEMNILPTATNPLSRLEDYNGRNSNIIPHAVHAMESIASLPDEATKFNFATGGITLRNYIQKRAGILAERKHTYGALLVEVDSEGNWYVRQLTVGEDGAVYDIGPSGYRGVKVKNGKVQALRNNGGSGWGFADSIMWGDIHASEMDLDVRELAFGEGGMLDQLRPARQFWHDLYSMRSRGHHEMKNFHRMFVKWADNEDSVEDEIQITADFAHEAHRDWCETIVVRSNHDRHLDRWLNEARPERDPRNAEYFHRLQSKMLAELRAGNRDFNICEWALRGAGKHGIPEAIRFLAEDESYVICKDHDGGVECGLHGDLGVNGSRGSTRGLRRLARRVNKDHDHTAAINGPVWSGGACARRFPYMKGPHTHSVSHIVTFENSARQIITFWADKFRA